MERAILGTFSGIIISLELEPSMGMVVPGLELSVCLTVGDVWTPGGGIKIGYYQ